MEFHGLMELAVVTGLNELLDIINEMGPPESKK